MTQAQGIDSSRVKKQICDTLGVSPESPWYLAYSGGLDSTVLLHLLAGICRDAGIQLVALHADHGIHGASSEWQRHCERQCREWNIDCRVTRLELAGDSALGPEGEARRARYHWFSRTAGDGAWLFTAHHLGDQAETVVERLARGAGPRGLRGILPTTRVYGLRVVRPLLDVPRDAIREYAAYHALTWVTDESNEDTRFTRNYIRNRVLPVLEDRWPAVQTALARTARVMADAQRVLDHSAEADLRQLDDRAIRGDPSLSIRELNRLTPDRQRNVLRHWIHRELGVTPGFGRLNRIVKALERHPDHSGGLNWPPVDLRTYRDRLYLVRPFELPVGPWPWNLEDDLLIGDRLRLWTRETSGQGLGAEAARRGVTVGFRRGGEKCRLPGRRHRHVLKKVLQDAAVPPWQRSRIPLIHVNDDIAAIAGISCCEPYAAAAGEPGVELEVTYR